MSGVYISTNLLKWLSFTLYGKDLGNYSIEQHQKSHETIPHIIGLYIIGKISKEKQKMTGLSIYKNDMIMTLNDELSMIKPTKD